MSEAPALLLPHPLHPGVAKTDDGHDGVEIMTTSGVRTGEEVRPG